MSRCLDKILPAVYALTIVAFLLGLGELLFANFTALGVEADGDFEKRTRIFLWLGAVSAIIGAAGIFGFLAVERVVAKKYGESEEGMYAICASKAILNAVTGVAALLLIVVICLFKIGVKEDGTFYGEYFSSAVSAQALVLVPLIALLVLFIFNICENLSDYRYYRENFSLRQEPEE